MKDPDDERAPTSPFTPSSYPHSRIDRVPLSSLNGRHMQFAWLSLVWVAFTDVYIDMLSTDTLRDLTTW